MKRKYIDADKLLANLRRQKRELELSIQSQGDFGQSCQIIVYESILSLLAALQEEQSEVDLEKEFKKWWDSVASSKINVDHSMYWYMEKCAEHFYELGKNAK